MQLTEVELNQKITEAVRAAVRASVMSSTNKDGRIEKVGTFFSEGAKFLEGEQGSRPKSRCHLLHSGPRRPSIYPETQTPHSLTFNPTPTCICPQV